MGEIFRKIGRKCLDKWELPHYVIMSPPGMVLLLSAIFMIGGIHWKITQGVVSGCVVYFLISLLGLALIVEAGNRIYYWRH